MTATTAPFHPQKGFPKATVAKKWWVRDDVIKQDQTVRVSQRNKHKKKAYAQQAPRI